MKFQELYHGVSSKSWIELELFDLWLTLHFLRYIPPACPLKLLMDGHLTHYCPAIIKYAAKESHTTHPAFGQGYVWAIEATQTAPLKSHSYNIQDTRVASPVVASIDLGHGGLLQAAGVQRDQLQHFTAGA